jgi:hypothetical protein
MDVRGHHLFCIYCFYGSGKEKAKDFFGVDNAIPDLLHALQADPETEITVRTDMDEVCEICPLKRSDGCGRSADAFAQNQKLRKWDRSLLAAIGLSEGDHIKARELEQRIRKYVPDVSIYCTNCTSAAPSGWAEYRIAIKRGLWPEEEDDRRDRETGETGET